MPTTTSIRAQAVRMRGRSPPSPSVPLAVAAGLAAISLSSGGGADAANSYAWTPSVSLTADLDEPDALGFCLDIHGFRSGLDCTKPMQAHSCKAAGADTQFGYDAGTMWLRAVNYDGDCAPTTAAAGDGACVALRPGADGTPSTGDTMSLEACDATIDLQRFEAVAVDDGARGVAGHELRVAGLCIVVADATRQAGRFVARDLYVEDCTAVPADRKTWTLAGVVGGAPGGGGGGDAEEEMDQVDGVPMDPAAAAPAEGGNETDQVAGAPAEPVADTPADPAANAPAEGNGNSGGRRPGGRSIGALAAAAALAVAMA